MEWGYNLLARWSKSKPIDLVFEFLKKHWPLVALLIFAGYLHQHLLEGRVLESGDHQTHLFKGWLMAEHFLPSGRLVGWSHMAYAGYPAGMYYPIGGYLYLSAIRYLSLGLLNWEMVYGVAMFLLMLLMPTSVYLVARRAVGPFSALIAGLLAIGDVGYFRQGGSIHTIRWGVWPFVLSVALFMTAISRVEPALSTRFGHRPGPIVALAVVLALAVLCHPMAAIAAMIVMPIFFAVLVIARIRSREALRILGRSCLAVALSVGLIVFWLAPQIAADTEATHSFGREWHPLGEMVRRHLTNGLFRNFSWIAWALSLLGLVVALASCKPYATSLALAAIVVFVFTGFGGGPLSERIQVVRLVAFEKLLCFALAGIAVDWLAMLSRWIYAYMASKLKFLTRTRVAQLIGIVVAVFVVYEIVTTDWRGQYARVPWHDVMGRNRWASFKKANEWIARQSSGPLDRVLYAPGKACFDGSPRVKKCRRAYSSHYWDSGPVWGKQSRLRFGFEPTAMTQYLPLNQRWRKDAYLIKYLFRSRRVLERLHVRWIVSNHPWREESHLQPMKRFRNVYVTRVLNTPDVPVTVRGSGELQLQRFDDEEIVFDLTGTSADTVVQLPVAFHDWWRATHNGGELKIDLYPLTFGTRDLLMSLPGRDGRTVLRFTRPRYARIASLFSLFCWIGCLFLIIGKRR